MDDRRDGVEEGERLSRRSAPRIASASAGEVSGPVATMTSVPLRRRQARDLAALDRDERMGLRARP